MICGLDPVHPGEILRSDVIEASGMSVTDFAKKLGVSRTAISLVLNERAGISIDMALRLSQVLGTSAEVWIDLQTDYDLSRAKKKTDVSMLQRIDFNALSASR